MLRHQSTMSSEDSSQLAPEDLAPDELALEGLSLEPSVEPELQPLPDPLIVTFTIGAHIPYNVPGLTLHGRAHEVRVELRADSGAVVFKSSPFDLGNVHFLRDKVLFGTLSFTYTYDVEERTITVCSTDYASSAGMALTTTPEGTESFCIERASGAGFVEDDISADRLWSYRTPLTPGAEAIFKSIVRGANDALIEALMDVPGLILTQRTPFPNISSDLYFDLTNVWHEGELVGTFDVAATYEPGWSLITPFSLFGGLAGWLINQRFSNASGTTRDQIPRVPDSRRRETSWIRFWQAATGLENTGCTSRNHPGDGFYCDGVIIGGHVVKVPDNEPWRGQVRVPPGSDSVCIIPICHQHNVHHDARMMTSRQYTSVVKLRNFFHRE
jgi:hypothetical protein